MPYSSQAVELWSTGEEGLCRVTATPQQVPAYWGAAVPIPNLTNIVLPDL